MFCDKKYYILDIVPSIVYLILCYLTKSQVCHLTQIENYTKEVSSGPSWQFWCLSPGDDARLPNCRLCNDKSLVTNITADQSLVSRQHLPSPVCAPGLTLLSSLSPCPCYLEIKCTTITHSLVWASPWPGGGAPHSLLWPKLSCQTQPAALNYCLFLYPAPLLRSRHTEGSTGPVIGKKWPGPGPHNINHQNV